MSVVKEHRFARQSAKQIYAYLFGGAEGDRTPDLMLAKHALSQLSYSPIFWWAQVDSNH